MSAKEDLNKLISDLKFKQFSKNAGSEVAKEARKEVIDSIAPAIRDAISSVGSAVSNAMAGVRFTPNINVSVPDVHVPHIEVPTPIVNYTPPAIKIPDIKLPEEMNIKGWVNFLGYDKSFLTDPLPVQLRDAQGNPVSLGGGVANISGGGGKADYLTIKAFSQSAFSELMNADGRIKVETNDSSISISDTLTVNQLSGSNWSVTASLDTTSVLYNADNRLRVSVETGGSGLTDSELRASSVPVAQASDAQWTVQVKEIFGSTITTLLNGDNRIPVSVETGGSGLTDSELRATAVPVSQVSGANWSVSVIGTVTVDGSGVTQPVSASNLDIRDLDFTTDDVSVYQVSGHRWSTEATQSGTWNVGTVTAVTDITNSVKAALIDSSGVQYSGSNPLPVDITDATIAVTQSGTWDEVGINDSGNSITVDATNLDIRDLDNTTDSVRVYQLSGASWSVEATQSGTWNIGTVTSVTNSVAASLVDSGGVQYSGSNPVPVDLTTALDQTIDSIAVRQVSGFSTSVQSQLIARTTNPTAATDATAVFATADDLGRTLVRPIQVRDLIATAYVSLTNGTETTLLAGAASTFHDLIYVMCANQSDAATFVDFRCGTAGEVTLTVQVPASGTAGVSLSVPHKMPEVAQAWTADMPDITGTTMDITGQFSKEI